MVGIIEEGLLVVEQDDQQHVERCDHPDSGRRPVQGGGRAVQVQKADRPLRLCRSCHWSCAFHYKGLHSLAAQLQ